MVDVYALISTMKIHSILLQYICYKKDIDLNSSLHYFYFSEYKRG